jgi:hypothetical protein
MSISTIQSALSTPSIQPIAGSPPQSTTAASAANGVSVAISQPGQLFSQLSSLAQSDPAQFKAVTAQIAQQLTDAASSATGAQADFLKKVAANFTAASQSGNSSDLMPKVGQGGKGHHGHHHHAASAASTAPGTSSSDSVGQVLQGIISNALDSVSASSSSSATTSSGS